MVVVSMFTTDAFLPKWTGFKALRGDHKYVYSNTGTNLEWKMIINVVDTKGTWWKVAHSGKQG